MLSVSESQVIPELLKLTLSYDSFVTRLRFVVYGCYFCWSKWKQRVNGLICCILLLCCFMESLLKHRYNWATVAVEKVDCCTRLLLEHLNVWYLVDQVAMMWLCNHPFYPSTYSLYDFPQPLVLNSFSYTYLKPPHCHSPNIMCVHVFYVYAMLTLSRTFICVCYVEAYSSWSDPCCLHCSQACSPSYPAPTQPRPLTWETQVSNTLHPTSFRFAVFPLTLFAVEPLFCDVWPVHCLWVSIRTDLIHTWLNYVHHLR